MKNMKEEAKIAKFNHQFIKTESQTAQISTKSNGSAFFLAAIRKKII